LIVIGIIDIACTPAGGILDADSLFEQTADSRQMRSGSLRPSVGIAPT
jgi:hypothetical protein